MLITLALGVCFAVGAVPLRGQEKKTDPKVDPKSMDPKGQTADPKKSSSDDGSGATDDPPTKAGPKDFKFSPNTVVVIVEELKDALQRFPGFVLVAQEKLLEMQERIAKLERQLKPDKEYPHSCKLSGRLEGELLILKAGTVAGHGPQPRTTVGRSVFKGLSSPTKETSTSKSPCWTSQKKASSSRWRKRGRIS